MSSEQVRAYAVSVLERADDEELQCYLLQLVQALRFERSDKSRLSHFLVQRCMFTTPLLEFPLKYALCANSCDAFPLYINTSTTNFQAGTNLAVYIISLNANFIKWISRFSDYRLYYL